MGKRRSEELYWSLGASLRPLNEELRSERPAIARGHGWRPHVDVIDEPRRVLVRAEIAGVRAEDIQAIYQPERNSILIRGVREAADASEGQPVQLEIFYGEFEREVPLPDVRIDADHVRASYRNGLLLVVIPKVATRAIRQAIVIRNS